MAAKYTKRQEQWAQAAKEPRSGLAAGLFALLSLPNEQERTAGIATSPLQEEAKDEEEAKDDSCPMRSLRTSSSPPRPL